MTGRAAARESLRAWLMARSLRQWVLATGAVVLLVSGLFGGLRTAEADGIRTIEVGETIGLEPFDVTVERARWTTDLGGATGASEVGRYLIVFATVRSTSDESIGSEVVHQVLRVDGLEGFARRTFSDERVASIDADPRTLVADDAVALGNLNPGITYEIAFVWEQELSEPLPAELDLVGFQHGFRQSSLDFTEGWFDAAQSAVGSVPLEPYAPTSEEGS